MIEKKLVGAVFFFLQTVIFSSFICFLLYNMSQVEYERQVVVSIKIYGIAVNRLKSNRQTMTFFPQQSL